MKFYEGKGVNYLTIFFYKEFGELGYLASYSNHGFYKNGVYWKTVEHYYQAQKFDDETIRQMIIMAETPKMASIIGRNKKYKLRKGWDEIKVEIMYEAVLEKFLAHPDLAKKLINTGNEEIVEATTKEDFWGCGPNKTGENNYGRILCKVREKLKEM